MAAETVRLWVLQSFKAWGLGFSRSQAPWARISIIGLHF